MDSGNPAPPGLEVVHNGDKPFRFRAGNNFTGANSQAVDRIVYDLRLGEAGLVILGPDLATASILQPTEAMGCGLASTDILRKEPSGSSQGVGL